MRKQLRCPICNRRLIDAEVNIETELRAFDPAMVWKADYYLKCWKCKSSIGLKKINKVS
jgi:phage FluMu protein Com